MQSEQFQLHAEIEERHWWFVARRQILASVIGAVLPPSKETTIVDVGCGTGANLALLADHYDCVGIDVSSEAIDLAGQRFPQVRFISGLAPVDLGATMQDASLVMATDVLEHVADDFGLFAELFTAAAPGTYFLLTVPADITLWSEHDKAFGHYRRYDEWRFEQLWRELPVRELFVSHFNSRLYPVVKAIRRLNQRRGRAGGQAGTDFEMPSPLANWLLTACFAGERHRLTRLARGKSQHDYKRGVSLMALLQKPQATDSAENKHDHAESNDAELIGV